MAAFSLGTSNIPGANAALTHGIAGAVLAINTWAYLDESQTPNKWEPTDADALATASGQIGLVCAPALENGPCVIQTSGLNTMSGATATKGAAMYLGTGAGEAAPFADLASGDFPVYLGSWYSATVFDIRVHALGVAI